jgi:hypothetical protein
MERRALPEEDQGPFLVVLELRFGDDVAEQEANDIGIVGELKGIGFVAGNAIANTTQHSAHTKLVEAPKSFKPRQPADRHARSPSQEN